MNRRRWEWRAGVVGGMLALLAASAPLEGQWREVERDRRPRERASLPSAYLGIGFVAANPTGEFGMAVDDAFGVDLEGRFPLSRSGPLSLRVDGGFLVYGHERQSMCFPLPVGCRVGVDLNTWNTIAFVGVGPEITVPGSVRPYVNGSVGLTWFLTRSSLSGADDHDSSFNTTNYSDWVTSLRAGAGVRFRIAGSERRPVLLDVGAQYHRNGVANYLREGDIVDYPDGTIELFPRRSETNLGTFRVGVSFGLGGGPDEDRSRDRPAERRGW